MTVFHSGHLFHLPKLSGQPYCGQKTLITVNIFPAIFSGDFSATFFPAIFFNTDHIIRSAKRRSETFLKASEPKTDPRAFFLRGPKSHASAREGAWPTFWCRVSTCRLVRRRLALLSLHQSSCAHTPQQNGVAECKNRHLVETFCTLLLQSHVPFCFWRDAVLTTCHFD